MSRSPYFSWLLLLVWGSWASAVTGCCVQFTGLGRWSPDLALALLVALAARTSVHDIAKLAICVGLARSAVSVDAPSAVIAATLTCGALLRVGRSVVQIENPLIAGAFAGALYTAQSAWLQFVHWNSLPGLRSEHAQVSLALAGAVSTGVVCALSGGVLANLPGLSQLSRRRSWVVGASLR